MSDPLAYNVWGGFPTSPAIIEAPLSKSFFYRLGGLLFTGRGCVIGVPDAEDADSVIDIVIAGGGVLAGRDRICLDYLRESEEYEVNVGCSGGALRVTLPALLAAAPIGSVIRVKMCSRLFERLEDASLSLFQMFGRLEVHPENGTLLIVKERDPLEYSIVATESSQPISGALIAAAVTSALYDTPVRVGLTVTVSRGHVYQTLEALRMARVSIDASIVEAGRALTITGYVHAKQRRLTLRTPGDWGLASLLAPLASHTKLVVSGLWKPWPNPGDHNVAEYLRLLGYSSMVFEEDDSTVKWVLEAYPGDNSDALELYVGDTPDLAVTLVYAAAASGETIRVKGVGHLALKESNRLESITRTLRTLGFRAYHGYDFIVLETGADPKGGIVECPGDHRIAMGVASIAAALGLNVVIVNPECVSKSWRSFWSTITRLGVHVEPV